jgi:hypothetical protein
VLSRIPCGRQDSKLLISKPYRLLARDSLSKSDKAFLAAIDDSKHHVTINAVEGDKDSSVFFGGSHGATHTINFDQTALLDSPKNAGGMTAASLVGHETLEGYQQSIGYSMTEGHNYACGSPKLCPPMVSTT